METEDKVWVFHSTTTEGRTNAPLCRYVYNLLVYENTHERRQRETLEHASKKMLSVITVERGVVPDSTLW